MRRDMDLIRQIVMAVRELSPGEELQSLDGVAPAVFAEHAKLLIEAGIAEGVENNTYDGREVILQRLTWNGHDFADAVVDDTIWRKAKERVIKPAASWSFGILTEFLKSEIKRQIGMPE